MKKLSQKALSILMLMCLILTSLPFAALAEESTTEQPAAVPAATDPLSGETESTPEETETQPPVPNPEESVAASPESPAPDTAESPAAEPEVTPIPTPAPKASKIRLRQTGKITVNLGETFLFEAELEPAGAESTLTWKSSNTKVATVENGVVTPHKEGKARITVVTDTRKSAYANIVVVDPTKPSGVTLDKTGTVTLDIDKTLTLNYALKPETAVSDVTWKSSNAKIATVENGVVTPLKEGTVTITVTTVKQKKSARVKIKVVDPYKPSGVALDKTGTVTLDMGQTLTLNYALKPETAVSDVTWKSSNAKIATVENGVVTPLKEGTVTITVTTVKQKKSARVKIKVVDPYKPSGVALDKTGTVTLDMGQTLTLNYALKPETAVSDVTWKSSNAKIATVENGVVTPLKEGSVTITVTTVKQKKSARVKIKVVDPYKPSGVALDHTGTVTLDVAQTLMLNYTLQPATAVSGVTWKSSNSKIVSVDSGYITAHKEGTATITVTTKSGNKRASVKIKVIDPTKIDVGDYFDSDFYAFVRRQDLVQDADYDAEMEFYYSDRILVGRSRAVPEDQARINYIALANKSNYKLMGLSIGMSASKAKSTLASRKWTLVETESGYTEDSVKVRYDYYVDRNYEKVICVGSANGKVYLIMMVSE